MQIVSKHQSSKCLISLTNINVAYEDANERLKKVKDEFKKQLLQFQKNVLLPANSWEIVSMIIKLLKYTQTNIFKTSKSSIHRKIKSVR